MHLPGSSIHGIFQARVLEWGAIAFSKPILTSKAINMETKTTTTKNAANILIENEGFTSKDVKIEVVNNVQVYRCIYIP